ncbi:unnamed protein product [marine sediment metagenome]|uniref:Uncharacterized protein n=1 Tax=marine sediment metagenome TaxID=412755 RepID=X1RKU4_9ZZZZ
MNKQIRNKAYMVNNIRYCNLNNTDKLMLCHIIKNHKKLLLLVESMRLKFP